MQHVILPLKLARGFDADDVVRLLHHADHFRVAAAVAAILAQLARGDVVADAAQAELILDVQDGLRQVLGVVAAGAQHVEGEALRRLLADAGKALEFRDQPRERLHAWLHEKGNAHLADAVENASLTIVGGDLNVVAPKSYALYFKDRGFEEAVQAVFGRPLRLKLTTPEAGAGPAPGTVAAPPKTEAQDEATGRALANPEVRRFREVFGGEVRKVRNLKE